MLVLLLPAVTLIALGVVVGWYLRGYHEALRADGLLDVPERLREAFGDVEASRPATVLPFSTRRPYDWSSDGGAA